MHQTLDRGTQRPTATVVWLVAALVLLLSLLAAANALLTGSSAAGPASSAQAALAPGTEGLLRQTASHLSKLLGGASVGGFPGFEPPGDDDDYRNKIKKRSYTAEEVNYWVKEINNFLGQIVKKNPGMSLEEILQKQGLNASQIENFLDALREIEVIARSMQGHGVTSETVTLLGALMDTLGIVAWVF